MLASKLTQEHQGGLEVLVKGMLLMENGEGCEGLEAIQGLVKTLSSVVEAVGKDAGGSQRSRGAVVGPDVMRLNEQERKRPRELQGIGMAQQPEGLTLCSLPDLAHGEIASFLNPVEKLRAGETDKWLLEVYGDCVTEIKLSNKDKKKGLDLEEDDYGQRDTWPVFMEAWTRRAALGRLLRRLRRLDVIDVEGMYDGDEHRFGARGAALGGGGGQGIKRIKTGRPQYYSQVYLMIARAVVAGLLPSLEHLQMQMWKVAESDDFVDALRRGVCPRLTSLKLRCCEATDGSFIAARGSHDGED
jgi:hypothetical protein